MPLFALALNFGWEAVYGLLIAEEPLERTAFQIWLLIDIGLVYGLLRHGSAEWAHAPLMQAHLGALFSLLAAGAALGHWCFARWWLAAGVGAHRGKTYGGRASADTTELGFWSATVCQAYLSAASLAQLLVRGHSRGVGWAVWATRALGTLLGLYAYYGFRWWFWPEGHEYVATPFALFLCGVGALADCLYPFALALIKAAERAPASASRDKRL